MDKFFANARVQAAFLATFPLKDNDTPEQHVKRYVKKYMKQITEDYDDAEALKAALASAKASAEPLDL